MRLCSRLFLCAACLVFSGAPAPAAPAPDKADPPDPLAGSWVVTSVLMEGKELVNQMPRIDYSFDKGKLVVKLGTLTPQEFTYTTNAASEPASVDLVPQEGFRKGKPTKAIYRVDGDKLILCEPLMARGERPKDFNADKEANVIRLIMKKKPS